MSHEVIVNLIAATTTRKGLTVRAEIDDARYEKGITVSDTEFAAIRMARDELHGEWNYVISPNPDRGTLLFYASVARQRPPAPVKSFTNCHTFPEHPWSTRGAPVEHPWSIR